MLSILIVSFVLVCSLGTIALALRVIFQERRQVDEIILAAEPLRPEWIDVRMDVPGKYPTIRTRRTKVLR